MKQRWIRILVYEGDPSWIESCKKTREVKGSHNCICGIIKEAIVGDFLEEVIERVVTQPKEKE